MVLHRCISQTIERANSCVQFWSEVRMHPVEDGHHQPGDLAPNVHVLIYALGETDTLLVTVIHVREPRFHAIAGVVDCGMYFPEGSYTSFTYGLQNKRRRHARHDSRGLPHYSLNHRNRLPNAIGDGKDFPCRRHGPHRLIREGV